MPGPPPPPPPPPPGGLLGPPPPPPPMMTSMSAPVSRNDVLKSICDPSAGMGRLKKVDRSQINDRSAATATTTTAPSIFFL